MMGEQESEHMHTVHTVKWTPATRPDKECEDKMEMEWDFLIYISKCKMLSQYNFEENRNIWLRPECSNKKPLGLALCLTVKPSTEKALCISHVQSVYSFEKIYGTDTVKSLFSLW